MQNLKTPVMFTPRSFHVVLKVSTVLLLSAAAIRCLPALCSHHRFPYKDFMFVKCCVSVQPAGAQLTSQNIVNNWMPMAPAEM